MPRLPAFLTLNPITRRRLQRFRQIRQAWFALWMLVGIYVLSLFAELICNSNPLFVRFEGKNYYPFLAAYNDNLGPLNNWIKPTWGVYPEDTFLHNGILTQPNYKLLEEHPVFAESDSNHMVFTVLPYGPNEVAPVSSIQVSEDVDVTFYPHSRVGDIEVNKTLGIDRSNNAAYFFGKEDERDVRDLTLDATMKVPPALQAALDAVFANQTNPEWTGRVTFADGKPAIVSLRSYEPRSRARSRVSLRLEEPPPDASLLQHVIFGADAKVKKSTGEIWGRLSEDERAAVTALVEQRQENVIEPQTLTLAGDTWRMTFAKEDVNFPFRPVGRHLMGLDNVGKDVLSRILYATRISMNFGIVLVTATFVIGILFGAIQGYLGGIFDIVAQRGIEIWSALPFLYVLIFLGSVMERSFWLLLVIYAVFNWIGISYYMRAEFLKLRRETYVEAARCLGIPAWKILLRHILPNALTPIITFFPFSLVGAIGALSGLDYLGYGLPIPTPSWGELMSQAMTESGAWWLVLYPFLALFIIILLGVFIGDGLRNAFDPRSKSHIE